MASGFALPEVLPGAGEGGTHAFEGRVAGGGVVREHGQVLLALAGKQGGDEADADASAEVAHEGGESADLVVFFLRDARVAERVDGDEEEGQAEGDDDAPTDGQAEADVEIDLGHAPEAEGGDDEADGDELAGIEFGRECAGDGEEGHEHESAAGDGHAGLAGGVAHDLLEKLRE